MTHYYSYLFEAKSIQRYILDSGRLADLIGASDLVADLCSSDEDDLLAEVMVATKTSDLEPSRRAGAAFCLHAQEAAPLNRLRALWRLALGLRAPGMAYTDTGPVEGANDMAALSAAYGAQPGLRENDAAFLLPTGGPMAAFSPRTGRVAVEKVKKKGEAPILLDAVTAVQHAHGKALIGKVDRLAKAFLPEDAEAAEGYLFPRHFEPDEANAQNPAFAFGGAQDQRVAVIHADISGLGQTFRAITASACLAGEVFAVAAAIEAAIVRAARKAAGEQLLPFAAKTGDKGFDRLFGKGCAPEGKKVVPARPVLLGGDDITIIARADLAIGFTRKLLDEIEAETAKAFHDLRKNHGHLDLPEAGLTACAGVAVVSAGHPFAAANGMAEGMCTQAKGVAKHGRSAPYPACLTFAVITSTIDEDFRDDYREREQKTADGCYLNARTYLVSGAKEVPVARLANLVELARALAAAPGRGKLVTALGLRHDDVQAAQQAWGRYLEVLESDDAEAFKALRVILHQCLGKAAPDLKDDAEPGDGWPALDNALPVLNDALELIDIGALETMGVTS